MEPTTDIVIETPQSSGVRGDLNYRLIVMRQVDRCGITLSKLPHEGTMVSEGALGTSGCTYQDIARSFSDGVRLLESLLTPYFDKEYKKQRAELNDEYRGKKNITDADMRSLFFQRYGLIISLCARLGMLLEPMGAEGV